MDIYQTLVDENSELTARLKQAEDENNELGLEVEGLRKSLDKQKNLHRKFTTDVIESERLCNETFKLEKRSLADANKSLNQENRQLKKDLSFYKQAYEEVAKEKESAHSQCLNKRSPNKDISLTTDKGQISNAPRAATEHKTLQKECKHHSSRALTKVNEKLFIENRKQKTKINSLSAAIQFLKTKNRQLESYKNKIASKNLKFTQERDALQRLIESSTVKNKDIYTLKVLAKLDELSK